MHATPISRHNPRPSLRPLVAAAALALGAASSAQAQSLLELFQAARDHDANYLSAVANAKATRSRGNQAWAGVLPTVGYSADKFESKNNLVSNPPTIDSDSQTLSIKQPLFQMNGFLGVFQGEHTIDVSERQLQTAEQDLVIRITQAYFDVLASQDSLTFVRAQKTAVAEQLAFAKRNFEVGTSTITDTREAQARFDLVIAQEIAADNDLRIKRLALDQLVGKPDSQPKPLQPLPWHPLALRLRIRLSSLNYKL